jgi:hypothetical protein
MQRHDGRVIKSKARAELGGDGDGLDADLFRSRNHVDLYPWNNLVSPQLPSTLAGAVPFAIYLFAFATGTLWLMLIGVVHSYIWLLLQVRQWWIPYLLGPTPIHKDFG